MAKMLPIYCGTCRHPQMVPVSHVTEIDMHGSPSKFVSLRLAFKRPVYDWLSDRQWRRWVVADRAAVLPLLRLGA